MVRVCMAIIRGICTAKKKFKKGNRPCAVLSRGKSCKFILLTFFPRTKNVRMKLKKKEMIESDIGGVVVAGWSLSFVLLLIT